MKALCMIREAPHYRRDAFVAGLQAAGLDVHNRQPGRLTPDDVLVIWNRYDIYAAAARQYEAAGAAVIVAENGIIGASENEFAKQYDPAGDQLYTLALDYHNGAGRWPSVGRGRAQAQGIGCKPWRADGDHVIVLPQRGFGPPEVAPPTGWVDATVARLKRLTHRPVRVRPHPGNYPAKTPLADDLRDCWCCVTWGSGAAIKALCAGIPIYSDWPQWIGFPGALPLDQIGLDDPPHVFAGMSLSAETARRVTIDRVAACQWTVPEIASGEPFRRLLAWHARCPAAA